ncbi:MAG: hypothetical protein ACXVJK_01255, partial [Candidatus Aminicenantales bacterium]
MFTALYLKEWKEKALIFVFELGILVLLVGAQFILREKKDIQEWLIYAVLILFYPFAALILGAAGFEAEYRQGAWAYLFSRPVRKSTVWLAKFAALLSMLAALWLVFVVLWIAVPGIRELAGGARVLLRFSVESEFPWWSILQSGFLLTVAFSLSFLHERQFNILFVSLGVGFFLPAALWAVMNSWPGGFMAWLSPERVLPTFLICQVLIALAFAAASILTLARSDFSQPRKLTLGFVRWFAPLLLLALAGTAAWAILTPVPGERYLYHFALSQGDAYYKTHHGVFKYSAATDRVQWLAKGKALGFGWAMDSSGGKIAYTAYDIKSKKDIEEELWVVNADGSGRKRIFGRGVRENGWPQDASIMNLLISPDGTKIAILSSSYRDKPKARRSSPLWLADTDGTRLESLPDDSVLFGDGRVSCWVRLVAWVQAGKSLLLEKRSSPGPSAFNLWLYDVGGRTARMLLDDAMTASWLSPISPDGELLAIKYQQGPKGPRKLAVLDFRTLATTDITESIAEAPGQVSSQVSWDPKGARIAYVSRRKQTDGPDVYSLVVNSLAEHKTLAEKVMTKSEAAAQLYSPSWTADGAGLIILDREANGLRILGPDLKEIGRIAFPLRMGTATGLNVVGDQALV